MSRDAARQHSRRLEAEGTLAGVGEGGGDEGNDEGARHEAEEHHVGVADHHRLVGVARARDEEAPSFFLNLLRKRGGVAGGHQRRGYQSCKRHVRQVFVLASVLVSGLPTATTASITVTVTVSCWISKSYLTMC